MVAIKARKLLLRSFSTGLCALVFIDEISGFRGRVEWVDKWVDK